MANEDFELAVKEHGEFLGMRFPEDDSLLW
jgi:hypothetical protein